MFVFVFCIFVYCYDESEFDYERSSTMANIDRGWISILNVCQIYIYQFSNGQYWWIFILSKENYLFCQGVFFVTFSALSWLGNVFIGVVDLETDMKMVVATHEISKIKQWWQSFGGIGHDLRQSLSNRNQLLSYSCSSSSRKQQCEQK